jgi:hypothetical protein
MNDPVAASVIQSQVQPGETLLWAGRPGQGLRFQSSDLFLIPFSLIWGGFAVFWESQAIRMNTPLIFKLWGIPFVLIGLYFIAGRFLWDRWVRSKQIYALTDRRLIVMRGESVTSSSLFSLPHLALKTDRSGSGTIDFGQPQLGRSSGLAVWAPSSAGASFQFLNNANEVFALISRAQAAK